MALGARENVTYAEKHLISLLNLEAALRVYLNFVNNLMALVAIVTTFVVCIADVMIGNDIYSCFLIY